jgi:four helix bundle protein
VDSNELLNYKLNENFKMANFKNLRVWQDGIDLAEEIYRITNSGKFEKDYGLKDQIRRAIVSVSSNIAEGMERKSNRETVYYLNVAKGSIAEVITQLTIAIRIGYIDKSTFEKLEDKAEKIRASLKNLIKARGGFNPLNHFIWTLLPLIGF